MLNIGELFFINNERWKTVDNNAADRLCRFTVVDQDALGAALQPGVYYRIDRPD
ncbi:hypothetical protein ABU178_19515 [Pantoea osteomyelitidis]|uniref:Uncharacterized protein n=1 Tax=Pantoea osteomyelitidis TaxID=3230026 RepID=A0ABW7Q182_9GAMM